MDKGGSGACRRGDGRGPSTSDANDSRVIVQDENAGEKDPTSADERQMWGTEVRSLDLSRDDSARVGSTGWRRAHAGQGSSCRVDAEDGDIVRREV